MKKVLWTICLVAVWFLPSVVFARQPSLEEKIIDYDVEITIRTDATARVSERIKYRFPPETRKSGIFRDIPLKYKTSPFGTRWLKIKDISVRDDQGAAYDFTAKRRRGVLRLKIGDPDTFVSGIKIYEISYTVFGAINYFDEYDEFYWNAIGTEWSVPIERTRVAITAPAPERAECFVGREGATDACRRVGDSLLFTGGSLYPGNGMTVVVGMPVGTVAGQSLATKAANIWRKYGAGLLPLAVWVLMHRRWRKYGKDPAGKKTVVPQYAPPEGLTPGEVGTVVDEQVHSREIAATIVDLARRGYMKIRRIPPKGLLKKFSSADYEFVRLREADDDLASWERELFEGLFTLGRSEDSPAERVKISDIRGKFAPVAEKAKSKLYSQTVRKRFFFKNPSAVRGWYLAGAFVIVVAAQFIPILSVVLALLASAAIVAAYGWVMPKRSRRGVALRRHILGLKMYMTVAEKDRLAFHNAPEKNPQIFSDLLPYAIALGLERQWTAQFADILRQPPEWYESAPGTFVAADFVGDIGAMSSAIAGATIAKASSGSSGFSGGGVGGGFGGGGGGSW